MSDKTPQKYPRVGVFLILVSNQGKWLVDVREKEAALPYRELKGGESWEATAHTLLEDFKASLPGTLRLAGIGVGVGSQSESLVYCAFTAEAVFEASWNGYEWQEPENINQLNPLSLQIRKSFLSHGLQIWID